MADDKVVSTVVPEHTTVVPAHPEYPESANSSFRFATVATDDDVCSTIGAWVFWYSFSPFFGTKFNLIKGNKLYISAVQLRVIRIKWVFDNMHVELK